MEGTLIVVDCQYDFIDGSLACLHSEQAVDAIIAAINDAPECKVLYSADWHSPSNQSFKINGGIWPVHCVQDTEGAMLHKKFESEIKNPEQRPNPNTLFLKGQDDVVEEYSAFHAKNSSGQELHTQIEGPVTVSGIASEFCVRETVLALQQKGLRPRILADGLGYVDEAEHRKNLADLEQKGIIIENSESRAQ